MTLEHNRNHWSAYDWSARGEEWSVSWGSSEAQWYGTILPRIQTSVRDDWIVLEIGCGYGRWTGRLLQLFAWYYGVDLCANCVEHCTREYPLQGPGGPRFYETSGKSLKMIGDGTIDFCFSFDSLVHANAEVMRAYIPQIIAKLKPYGRAFVHHSNRADLSQPDQDAPNCECRGVDVSGELVYEWIRDAGGDVIVQELVAWGQPRRCIDAFTLFCRKEARMHQPVILRNHDFMSTEVRAIREYHSKYMI